MELASPWPQHSLLGHPPPIRVDCPLHVGELLPCRRCATWLAGRNLEVVLFNGGAALIERAPG